ncbi:MAG TPA: hypothetical protein VGM36_12050, partial [Rhizomicrobium sp.]
MGPSVDCDVSSLASAARLARPPRAIIARAYPKPFRFIDLSRDPPDPTLSRAADVDEYFNHLFVP